jgi:hypothetical protein
VDMFATGIFGTGSEGNGILHNPLVVRGPMAMNLAWNMMETDSLVKRAEHLVSQS